MVRRGRFRVFVVIIMSIYVATILVGEIIILNYLQKSHQLTPIGPASEIPSTEIIAVQAGSLVFSIEPEFGTYSFHSGAKGMHVRLDVTVTNVGPNPVDDLKFHKMTVYWESGEANFTLAIKPLMNHTIEPSQSIEDELRNNYEWPGIPSYLCWSGGKAYARLLLTTALDWVMNMVE